MAEFGYAGKILKVDLSSAKMTDVPTSNYTDEFIGGLGIATKMWWDELLPQIGVFDPENRLMFFTGPLVGFPGIAGSKWIICGKSPMSNPEHFGPACLGGSWGAHLKFAGYDGIVVQGKSEKPVYLLVQDGVAELRDASVLWGKSTIEVRNILKGELGSSVRVLAIGPAGENMVPVATILADEDSSGSAGFGSVMGSKKLKAIAVRGSGKVTAANPERLDELRKYIRGLVTGRPKNVNFSGSPHSADRMKKLVCFGCIREFDCMKANYKAADGETGKMTCGSGDFYISRAAGYYGEFNDVPFQANKLCDKYGLDTFAVAGIIGWLSKCYNAGVLTDESTGIPISKLGSLEFIETLVKKISYREGFGDILAGGFVRAADSLGDKAREVFNGPTYRTGRFISGYDPRVWIVPGLINATEPGRQQGQIHEIAHLSMFFWTRWLDSQIPPGEIKKVLRFVKDTRITTLGVEGMYEGMYMSSEVVRAIAKRFWGGELAQDFSTYEGKALATKIIQDRGYAADSLGLCDWAWPILEVKPGDHVGDPTLESKLYSAVTGNEVDEEGLYRIGERIFNLRRAILAREGRRGREDDKINEQYYTIPIEPDPNDWHITCLVPGKDGELLFKGGAIVDREKFAKMLDEYYQLRDWDVGTGLQTRAKLEELGLEDVAGDLGQRGLVK